VPVFIPARARARENIRRARKQLRLATVNLATAVRELERDGAWELAEDVKRVEDEVKELIDRLEDIAGRI
jgi:hypothetical protein